MRFGVHISGAGGLEHIPAKAKKLGCETFQFFSRSPRGGKSVLTDEAIEAFRKNAAACGFSDYYIHAPYYINLASAEERIYRGSIEVLRDELVRANSLGVRGVITHIGSARGMTHAEAIQRVIKGLEKIVQDAPAILFLEISAGSGDVIGDTLDEMHEIHSNVRTNVGMSSGQLQIALDTAHAFASGYDIRTEEGLNAMLDEYDRLFGLKNLEVIHVNDSKVGLGERKDRHEHIGEGKLGLEAFRIFVNEKRLAHINAILETPKDSDEEDLRNLSVLRGLIAA
ncbi:MAG: deoxyribonuclease IV [bacterium]|nr:deoxyribonuclease IV [bacterium]